MAITDGMRYLYSFDEGMGPRVDSVGSADFTVVQGVDTVGPTAGKLNNALDPTGTLVGMETVPGAGQVEALFGRPVFSAAYWVRRLPGFVGTDTVLNIFGSAIDTLSINLNMRFDNAATFTIPGQDALDFKFTAPLPVNQWLHITNTYNAHGRWKIYVDGALALDVPPSPGRIKFPDQPGTGFMRVGASAGGVGQCDCLIDQLIIWDREITQPDIDLLFNDNAGAFLAAATLNTAETRRIRDLVMENFLGVQVIVRGDNLFEWLDRRTSPLSPPQPSLREQIGPVRGNYTLLRAYLDPFGTVLPLSP